MQPTPLRTLTTETKDQPHVQMRGMTRHVKNGMVEDKIDDHHIPVQGYDDMSTIDINRKQNGWAVVGHKHLDRLTDKKTGRVRDDVVRMIQELDGLVFSPESRMNEEYQAQLRAEIEASVRAEMAAKAAVDAAAKAGEAKLDAEGKAEVKADAEPKAKGKKEVA